MNKYKEDLIELKMYREMDAQQGELFLCCCEGAFRCLERKPHISTTAFTPHGIPHCMDIFYIIDNLFFDPNIESEEWLLLGIAIAWHDVGMAEEDVDMTTRNRHVESSIQKLDEFFNEKSNRIYERGLKDSQKTFIKHIIRGHSGFPLHDIGDSDSIRLKLLSALLRMADELDICENRLIDSDGYHGETKSQEKLYSFACWEQCRVFKFPSRDNEKICLNVILENVAAKNDYKYVVDRNGTEGNIYDLIKKHFYKVEEAFYIDEIKSVFAAYPNLRCSKINSIELNFVKASINTAETDLAKSKIINIGNAHNQDAIKQYAAREKLLFELENCNLWVGNNDDVFCSESSLKTIRGRKINTYKLIQEDKNVVASILSDMFVTKLLGAKPQTVLLGIDYLGWILASILATMINRPFDVLIADHHENRAVDIHKTAERVRSISKLANEAEEIILVIDTIYTFTTVEKIIKKYALNKDKIKYVICLFNRVPYAVVELYKEFNEKGKILSVVEDQKISFVPKIE